jgi:pyridoxal phosphate enzyme (YggS family)
MLEDQLKKIDINTDYALSQNKVKLIAVSKYASDEQVQEAYKLGIRDFGENYIMPALKRQKTLNFRDEVRWHLLGPIQKNKINKVVGNFDLIHSVHTQEIAYLINQKAEALNLVQNILLQVNLTQDKSGFLESEIEEVFLDLVKLKNIKIQGLMLMNYHEISQKTETNFNRMRLLKEMMTTHCPDSDFELSMGMSNDYHLAVKNGATIIRIGRNLFS